MSYVRCAAVVFVTISSVVHKLGPPTWLVADLAGLSAMCAHSRSTAEACVASLRLTMVAAKQNRTADPFMVDHLLCRNGISDEKGAASFITKYNAQVFYDPALMLKDHAAKRQAGHPSPYHPRAFGIRGPVCSAGVLPEVPGQVSGADVVPAVSAGRPEVPGGNSRRALGVGSEMFACSLGFGVCVFSEFVRG
jgi:hypothetical protein